MQRLREIRCRDALAVDRIAHRGKDRRQREQPRLGPVGDGMASGHRQMAGLDGNVFRSRAAERRVLRAEQPRIMCHRKRSEEHPSELQSLMRISYAVFCLKKKTK